MDGGLKAWLMAGKHLYIFNWSDNVLFQCMNYCFTYNFFDDFTNSDRSEYMVLLAKSTLRELVWSYSTHSFFATLARAIHMSVELWPKLLDVSIPLQPSASTPKCSDPRLLRRAVFKKTSASMHSCFILCMDCVISSNKNCLSVSLWHGYFCFKRLRLVSSRGYMPFSELFKRSFMAPLILPLFIQQIS